MTQAALLSEIAEIERSSVTPDQITDGETYVGLENLTNDGSFVGVAGVAAGQLKSNKFRFDRGHVLYGKLRPYLAKISAPDFAGVCSTDILPIRPGPNVHRRYLLHYLRTPDMIAHASKLAVGINLPRLSPTSLAAFQVPLPPIEEQRRIAAVLDAADAIRGKRRQALAKLDTLTQAIFIDMFRSAGWNAWPMTSVESLASSIKGSIRTGPFGSQLLHEEFTDDGVAVLGIDNAVQNRFVWDKRRYISEGKYEQLRRYTVFPGDVLVTIMGTCGRTAIVPDEVPRAINTKHLCCITLDHDRCLPSWLWACLRFHPQVRHDLGATHGAVMPGLNMGRIKQAEIPVPSVGTQAAFAERKRAAELEIESHQLNLTRLDNLFSSLQQRAFRGEL